MIFAALSCLQGRPQRAAFEELCALPVDGVQLTPGNLPTPGFIDEVATARVPVRFHHGFDWSNYRRPIYSADGRPHGIARNHSVHPPTGQSIPWRAWLDIAREHDLLVETMYPGELLGTGAQIEDALDAGLRMAVDVSHLFIQSTAGALSKAQLHRLLQSPRVEEVHVSANDGRRDRHFGIDANAYLLHWARERTADLPVVLESYWHRTPTGGRRRQLDLLRGAVQ